MRIAIRCRSMKYFLNCERNEIQLSNLQANKNILETQSLIPSMTITHSFPTSSISSNQTFKLLFHHFRSPLSPSFIPLHLAFNKLPLKIPHNLLHSNLPIR